MRFRTPLTLVAAALLVGGALILSPGRADAAPTVNAPSAATAVTSAALALVGQWEGECRAFVQRIVQQTLGTTIGGDYRLGYIQAGAVEIPIGSAQAGDVLQLIDDRDSSATADYPGMHTAIVLENYGGGKFKVVDSNSNYDGIVRVRDYEPVAVASRYTTISVHAYHLPNDRIIPATTAVPTETVPLTTGVTAMVAADGDCLRVRSVPALTGVILTCAPTGAQFTVAGGAADADGYHWMRITGTGVTGWAVDQYLRGIAAPGSTASAPPSTTGTIISGTIPQQGFGLIVFGGGTREQLLAASGCPAATASFFTSADGQFVTYIPAVTIAAVNAAWDAAFPNGVPAGTPLMARCS